jgi:hypothetical protein
MTPTTVSIALVEGEKADGVIVERDVIDITAIEGSATSSASDHVIAAILGTQEGAVDAGHHLVSTGVAWSDHGDAAVLREAVVARGIEGVLLVSELHAAAALAQAVGRAVGYEKTALMFVERDTATLAVVETADGSVVKVLSRSLHDEDTIAVLAEMVTTLELQEPAAQGLFVVGSGVDVTAVKARLTDLVSVPVIAPEEPRLALARGAALASANAPRYDTSTFGLAYSQDPEGTTVHPLALAGDATTFLGDAGSDTDDIAWDSDEVPERSKPFLLSSVTAIFIAGMMALTIAIVVRARPAVDQGMDDMMIHPDAVAPATALPTAPQAASPSMTIPTPTPAAPPPAAVATARLKVPPAAPPPVLVRNAAPAPAAPAPAGPPPAPPPPPPVVLAPPIPPLVIQWLPPILQPPPFFNPSPGPQWNPGPKKPPGGRGGGGHGGKHGHGGD